MLDVLIDLHELVVGSDVETGSLLEKRFDDLLRGIRLDRIVALYSRKMLLKHPVIVTDDVVIDDAERGAMLVGETQKLICEFQAVLHRIEIG
jgi:hypothetical protein